MSTNPRVLVLNGPNLNLLGTREPEIYGHETLKDLEEICRAHGKSLGMNVLCRQSNHEGELVTWIHEAHTTQDALVINAGAYSHTSIALLDALAGINLPVMEVHLSNIYKRETFRHHSYISTIAEGVICGLGHEGYKAALTTLAQKFKDDT